MRRKRAISQAGLDIIVQGASPGVVRVDVEFQVYLTIGAVSSLVTDTVNSRALSGAASTSLPPNGDAVFRVPVVPPFAKLVNSEENLTALSGRSVWLTITGAYLGFLNITGFQENFLKDLGFFVLGLSEEPPLYSEWEVRSGLRAGKNIVRITRNWRNGRVAVLDQLLRLNGNDVPEPTGDLVTRPQLNNVNTITGFSPNGYFKVADFFHSRFYLGSTPDNTNLVTVSKALEPLAFDFGQTLPEASEDNSDGETVLLDTSGYFYRFVPEGGDVVILWMRAVKGTLYIGTDQGVIIITDTRLSQFEDVGFREQVFMADRPVSLLNALFFIGRNRKRIYRVEDSEELIRKTVVSASSPIYVDYLADTEVVQLEAVQTDDYMVMRTADRPKSLFLGRLKDDYSVGWFEQQFAEDIIDFTVIDGETYINFGSTISKIDFRDFSRPIENGVQTIFSPASPSLVCFIRDRHARRAIALRNVTEGYMVGEFDEPVDILTDNAQKPYTVSGKDIISFEDMARDNVLDSLRFIFRGRKNTILAFKYGVAE